MIFAHNHPMLFEFLRIQGEMGGGSQHLGPTALNINFQLLLCHGFKLVWYRSTDQGTWIFQEPEKLTCDLRKERKKEGGK